MNELHFAYKVRQHLNRGLHELSPTTLDRLAMARQGALAMQKQTATRFVLAAAGGAGHVHFEKFRVSQILAALALILCLAFSMLWVADQRVTELGDIDSALLADELPLGAFTDRGFGAWLRNSSSE